METWKPVPGLENYLVSDQGRVAKVMKPGHGEKQRYPLVSLREAGKRANYYVHELVLRAFVGERPEDGVVRHLNDVPTDNRLENLRWGTRSENQIDWRKKAVQKTHCDWGHPFVDENIVAESMRHGFRRCLACNRARAKARYHGIECTKELRDAEFERLVK